MGHLALNVSQKAAIVFLLVIGMTSPLPADGFGVRTTGGAGGTTVTVTTEGELQTYAASTLPYIITISGRIQTPGNLIVQSNKTIQGEDTSSTLMGDLYIGNGVSNVIIQHLNISNPSAVGDGDGVTIINFAKNVVVTHCTFTDCADGSLDITNQSDSVTVSWCRFRYVYQTTHRNVNLVGSSDTRLSDLGSLHITFHHCWYDQNCDERMPSVRFGRAHVYNNFYGSATASYGVRTRLSAECLVENNCFELCQNPWELLTKTNAPDGKLRALNNNISFLDTAAGNRWVARWYTTATETTMLIPGTDSVFSPPYSYVLDSAAEAKAKVAKYAGNTGGVAGMRDRPAMISDFALLQSYPNPFNPDTRIGFRLPRQHVVTLKVYDLLGREVVTLVNASLPPGSYEKTFTSDGLPGGVYFYRLEAGSFSQTQKMILIR
jgi:pectate lyase